MLAQRWRQLENFLPVGVNLLAVSKGQPASSIRCLAELGQRDFGESRLQEAAPKQNSLNDLKDLRWHFIGRLQANKVRAVIRSFEVIHSVDSLALAERISRIAGEEGLRPKLLLQVKLRDDPNKGGFASQALWDEWSNLSQLPNFELIGLMTMAPFDCGLDQRRQLFRDCRDLADQLELHDCSMGMSRDWKEAVEAGSTWVRLGSKLFGALE